MKNLLVLVSLCVGLSSNVSAAEGFPADGSLETQMEYIYESSKSYGNYKTVKIENLNLFRENLREGIKSLNMKNAAFEAEIKDIQSRLDQTNKSLKETELSLSEMTERADSISVLGLNMGKATYNSVMFTILFILIATLSIGGYMVKTRLEECKRNKAESLKLEKEVIELREKKLEAEIQLKRKLQTALNELEELKVS